MSTLRNSRGPGAPRLAATDLRLAVHGHVVLAGATLRVAAGEVVTIAGASGSGKTTLLRALATLVAVDAGDLRLDGRAAAEIAPTEYRRRVAYVPQQPPMLEGTVGDNLATGPRLHGAVFTPDDAAALLTRVGLAAALATRPARGLSGGERARVALARALANAPEVLLLDEPTAALDPAAADHVLELVCGLPRQGLAVVVVTHVGAHARALAGTHYACVAGALARAEVAPA